MAKGIEFKLVKELAYKYGVELYFNKNNWSVEGSTINIRAFIDEFDILTTNSKLEKIENKDENISSRTEISVMVNFDYIERLMELYEVEVGIYEDGKIVVNGENKDDFLLDYNRLFDPEYLKLKENNKTMHIDLYEFTMSQAYFDQNKQNEEVYFDLFFRKNPFKGGYTISGGLEETIEYIKNFHFTDEDIEYLRKQNKFSEDFLKYLRTVKFDGDIFSVPDGTPVFPNEPVITVKANTIIAQLIETALLTNFNHGALITTGTKRVIHASDGRAVLELGGRRGRGIDSAVEASKHAYIAGTAGTSNIASAKKYGIPAVGTMAHSLVTEAKTEYEAFLNYAKSNPNNALFLVDTYDTLRSGLPNAIRVAKEYLVPNGYKFKGIRIDSGDLAYLAKESRKMLDEAGFNDTQICVSNGLDEYTIKALLEQVAPIDTIGAGDNIIAPKERVGGVYKLVAVGEEARIKVSGDTIKTTNPGHKKAYRFYDKETGYALGDVIALADEVIPNDEYTLIHPVENWKQTHLTNYEVRELQVPIFKRGKLVYKDPELNEKREYCAKEFETLYPEVRRLESPHEYYVDLSENLLELKTNLIRKYTEIPKVKIK